MADSIRGPPAASARETLVRHDGGMAVDQKFCRSCGRAITWRKKWAADWDQVAYCSQTCRRRGVTQQDQELENMIQTLLAKRPRGGSITDTEAARALSTDGSVDLSEPARRAARRLVASGEVELVQRGRVVDPSTAKGSFSIRLRSPG